MKAKYLFLSGLMALATACSDDELYQNPSTSLSDETVVTSYENAKTVLMGAYKATEHFHYLTIGQIAQEVMGNDIKITNGNFG